MFQLLQRKQMIRSLLLFGVRRTQPFPFFQKAVCLLLLFLLATGSAFQASAQVDSSYFQASFQVEFNSWDFHPPYHQIIRTFAPATEGDKIYAHFENQSRLAAGDTMFAYDGSSTKAPLIGAYWGPETIRKRMVKATNAKGTLTLRFVSSTGLGQSFWLAKVRPTQPLGPNDVVMSSTPATTSGGKFYHPSYPFTIRYTDNVTQTIRPAMAGAKLQVNFTTFKPGNSGQSSALYVYDGTSTSSPLIGVYILRRPAYAVRATNPTGALTFQLVGISQEYDSPDLGWDATISYVTNACPNDLSLPETIPGVYPGHFYQVFLQASPAGNYRYTTTSGVTGLNFTTGEFTIPSGNGVIGKSMVVRATNENGCFVERAYTFVQGPRIPTNLADSLALVELYESTKGDTWKVKTNWLTGNVETWYGVGTYKGRVTQIYLEGNGLSGRIPASFGNLTGLQSVYLPENQLTGSIPASMGNLTAVTDLALYNNQLTDSIPSSIGNLKALTFLSLNNNQLSGPIPASIFDIKFLEFLLLSDNKLSGPVPASLGKAIYLEDLNLGNNQLSGAFPSSFNNIISPGYTNLSGNQFTSLPILKKVAEDNFDYFLRAENNRLTFESLEPNFYNFNMPLHYAPQDSVGTTGKQTLSSGQSLTLSALVGGANNRYQWTKNGVELTGATAATFTISNASMADQGWYSCTITNTVVYGLTLHRRSVFVQVTTPATTSSSVRINCGGPSFKVANGSTFKSDQYYSGLTKTSLTGGEIAGTVNDPIYHTDRVADVDKGSFQYQIPVTNGKYRVNLFFAETYFTAPGKRIMSVKAEGIPILTDYDIFAAQGRRTAKMLSYLITVTDGNVTLDFSASVNRPKINAIEIVPAPANAARQEGESELASELNSAPVLLASPNPFSEQTVIRFTAPARGKASILAYNLSGSVVKVLFEGELEEGQTKELTLEGAALPSGIYLVKAFSPTAVSHLKVVLAK